MSDQLKMKPGRILIVDDDSLVALNEQAILQQSGYLSDHAESIKEALHLMQNRHYDLLLLDHDLPDGKGAGLIKQIQSLGLTLPVVYRSAAQPKVLREVEKMPGVCTILTKPVSPQQLLEAVNTHFPEALEHLFPRLINRDERRLLLDFMRA